MRTLRFYVDGQRISKDSKCNFSGIVAGSKGYLDCMFSFSKDWENLAKVAVFRTADTTKYIPIVNNRCDMPDDVTDSTRIHVSVIGKDAYTALSTSTAVVMQQKGV